MSTTYLNQFTSLFYFKGGGNRLCANISGGIHICCTKIRGLQILRRKICKIEHSPVRVVKSTLILILILALIKTSIRNQTRIFPRTCSVSLFMMHFFVHLNQLCIHNMGYFYSYQLCLDLMVPDSNAIMGKSLNPTHKNSIRCCHMLQQKRVFDL